MPRTPVSQHQKMAPGPPRATAVETPTILPVPRVEASVVDRVAKTEKFLLSPEGAQTDIRIADRRCFCGNFNKSVK